MFFDLTVINADPGTLTLKSFADLPRQIRSYGSHDKFLLVVTLLHEINEFA